MRSIILAVACLATGATCLAQTMWYVDAENCTASGDGSIGNPFCRIQQAVDAATSGDEVVVLPGNYPETLLVSGIALRINAPGGAEATRIRGREYLPAIDVQSAADLVIQGLTITDAWPGIHSVGSFVTVLDCQIVANHGYGAQYSTEGGGMYVLDSTVHIERCAVTDNYCDETGAIAAYGGFLTAINTEFLNDGSVSFNGGIDTSGTQVTLVGCEFRGCGTGDGVGALTVGNGSLHVANSRFVQNGMFESVGSILIANSDALIESTTLLGEHSGFEGGIHVSNQGAQQVLIRNCLFEDNDANRGSSMFLRRGQVRVLDCVFRSNWATDSQGQGRGGAAFVDPMASTVFERCVFVSNQAESNDLSPGLGAAIYGPATASNCTFYRNAAENNGTVVDGGTVLENCIVYESVGAGLDPTVTATYSDIQGGWPGTGNFDADPMFWGPEHGDLHLLPGSPCIDTGDPNLTDQDGTRLDVGAYPFDAGYCGSPGTYCVAKVNSAGCMPAIGWTGTPSIVGPDNFHVVATHVIPNRFGILAWGTTGASDIPFLGGTLCIAPPQHRSPILRSSPGSGCDGAFDYHFTQAIMQANGIGVGTRLYIQYWYRDLSHQDGTGAGLTDGLEAGVCLGG